MKKKAVMISGIISFAMALTAFAGGEKEIHNEIGEEWGEVVDWKHNQGNDFFYLAVKSEEHLKLIQHSTEFLQALLKGDGFYIESRFGYRSLGYTSMGTFQSNQMNTINQDFNRIIKVHNVMEQRAKALCELKGYERFIKDKFNPLEDVRWMNQDLQVMSLVTEPGNILMAPRCTLDFVPGRFSGVLEGGAGQFRIDFPLEEAKTVRVPHLVFERVWCAKPFVEQIPQQQNESGPELNRPKLVSEIEENSRNYAERKKSADLLGQDGREISEQFKNFVNTTITQDLDKTTKKDLLSKIYYEVLKNYPSTALLDILMEAGFDPLHVIRPENDLRIDTKISRHICRFATRAIVAYTKIKSLGREESAMLEQTKVFGLHLFTKISTNSDDKDSIEIANRAIQESRTINSVAKRDKEFGEIISKIKRLRKVTSEKDRHELRTDISNLYVGYAVRHSYSSNY